MKNIMKVVNTLLSLLIITISLSACNIFTISGEISTGNLLSVDKNGHFKEDIVYTSNNSKETYKPDGTFENITFKLVNGNKEIKNGVKGTYSWDRELLLLKKTETTTYNSTTKTWEDLGASNYTTLGYTLAFFENQYNNAYIWNESNKSWSNSFISYYENGINEIENIISYKIDLDKNIISYTDVYTDYITNGEILLSTKNSVEGTINSAYPNGVKFKKGNQLTFNYTETLNTDRAYNTSTGLWSEPVNNTLNFDSFTILHMGDFLYIPESESYRGL